MHPLPIRAERHRSALGWSESVFRAPHPALRHCVVGEYQGWTECTRRTVARREVPTCLLPLILNLGAPFRLSVPGGEPVLHSSFTAGLCTRPTIVEPAGMSGCLQVNLTPLGAIRVLGMPLVALTDQTVELEDLFGPPGRRLVERLHAASGWDARFDLVDTFLLDRIEASRAPSPHLVRVWHRLQETDGNLTVAALAREIGYSRRQLTAQVREQLGLPPKILARIVRFNAALRRAERGAGSWAAIARSGGYFDQAHFVREFTALAGIPPREYLRRQLPDGGIYAG